jgi:hypothetical protein
MLDVYLMIALGNQNEVQIMFVDLNEVYPEN